MNYNIGINGSGFKFKHQLISNIGTTQVNADLKNGNYIQASINTAGNYGNLHITNTTNKRFGNLFVVEHIQAYTGVTYKPLILSGYIRSGYNTISKPGKSIGLLAGESVMLLQRTDTLYQPYFTAVGYNMNNLIRIGFVHEVDFCGHLSMYADEEMCGQLISGSKETGFVFVVGGVVVIVPTENIAYLWAKMEEEQEDNRVVLV
jgi:hypothetical protein